jgi:hypothetical protein
MSLFVIKKVGALLLGLINLALLAWAGRSAQQRAVLPDGYYRLLRFSVGIGAFQVGMGLFFLTQTYRAPGMHYLYGSLVGVGVLGQFLLGRQSALAERMRNRGWVHAFIALLITALAVRSWMSA